MATSFFIVAHACYVPFEPNKRMKSKNPNIKLHFDTELNSNSCSSDMQITFDKTHFSHLEGYMNLTYDYLLSFKDNTYSSDITSLKLLGIFDDTYTRIEIPDITNGKYNDVLFSDIIDYLTSKIRFKQVHFYCAFCRNECYPILDTHDFDDEPFIDYSNIFASSVTKYKKGGKRKHTRRKCTHRKSQKSYRKKRKN